jgi:hypothetical protein
MWCIYWKDVNDDDVEPLQSTKVHQVRNYKKKYVDTKQVARAKAFMLGM